MSDDSLLVPPTEMLFDGSSSSEQFMLFGENFCREILVKRAGTLASTALLDIGCGNGGVARALTRVLDASGRYEGIDINRTSIDWLQDRYRHYPQFHFHHADVFNRMYNPEGRCEPGAYRLPFADATFDIVMAKSVFTHMMPLDVRNYLSEISRVLKAFGRAVMTYFLLNEESRSFTEQGLSTISFAHNWNGDHLCRIVNPEVPEIGVAHDESRVRRYCAEVGLSLGETALGNWCGRPSLLGLQDLVIAFKM